MMYDCSRAIGADSCCRVRFCFHPYSAASGEEDAHLIKASAYSLVKAIGQVGGAKHEDAGVGGVDALHLHQKLCLDAPRCLALTVPPCAAQRVYLRTADVALGLHTLMLLECPLMQRSGILWLPDCVFLTPIFFCLTKRLSSSAV